MFYFIFIIFIIGKFTNVNIIKYFFVNTKTLQSQVETKRCFTSRSYATAFLPALTGVGD